jgi:pseudouridine synthase
VRLQQFLAQAGFGSRRKCEDLIFSKKVEVNGAAAFLGQKVNPDSDQIEVYGVLVKQRAEQYWLLYKPKGILSTVSDPHGGRTILDLIKIKDRVFPVGRLDKDSEGLMFLTNNGDLAYHLTHPKFQIEKIYEVLVDGIPSEKILKKISGGMVLEDGLTAPCKIKIIKKLPGKTILEIKLHEGKKREIRRMMKAAGYCVLNLKRTAIGPLNLLTLKPGKSRSLTKEEIQDLKNYVHNNSRKPFKASSGKTGKRKSRWLSGYPI